MPEETTTNTTVSAKKFVLEWNLHAKQGKTIKDLVNKLGMKEGTATTRASKYRSIGVRMDPLARVTREKLDAEELNDLANSIFAEEDLFEGEDV